MKVFHNAEENDLEFSEEIIKSKSLNSVKSEDISGESMDKITDDKEQDTTMETHYCKAKFKDRKSLLYLY